MQSFKSAESKQNFTGDAEVSACASPSLIATPLLVTTTWCEHPWFERRGSNSLFLILLCLFQPLAV